MFDLQYFGGVILFLVIALAVSMFRVLREYDRGVIFMLGRFYKVKGPGLLSSSLFCNKWCGWICARW